MASTLEGCDALHPPSNGLPPTSDGLHPNSDGHCSFVASSTYASPLVCVCACCSFSCFLLLLCLCLCLCLCLLIIIIRLLLLLLLILLLLLLLLLDQKKRLAQRTNLSLTTNAKVASKMIRQTLTHQICLISARRSSWCSS